MSCTLQPGFYEKYGTYQRDTSLETWWLAVYCPASDSWQKFQFLMALSCCQLSCIAR